VKVRSNKPRIVKVVWLLNLGDEVFLLAAGAFEFSKARLDLRPMNLINQAATSIETEVPRASRNRTPQAKNSRKGPIKIVRIEGVGM